MFTRGVIPYRTLHTVLVPSLPTYCTHAQTPTTNPTTLPRYLPLYPRAINTPGPLLSAPPKSKTQDPRTKTQPALPAWTNRRRCRCRCRTKEGKRVRACRAVP